MYTIQIINKSTKSYDELNQFLIYHSNGYLNNRNIFEESVINLSIDLVSVNNKKYFSYVRKVKILCFEVRGTSTWYLAVTLFDITNPRQYNSELYDIVMLDNYNNSELSIKIW
jgi:hypothetical protein